MYYRISRPDHWKIVAHPAQGQCFENCLSVRGWQSVSCFGCPAKHMATKLNIICGWLVRHIPYHTIRHIVSTGSAPTCCRRTSTTSPGPFCSTWPVTYILTWVVRPTVMVCMVLNILTQFPLHQPGPFLFNLASAPSDAYFAYIPQCFFYDTPFMV